MRARTQIGRQLVRFGANERGVAAVEFALILPIMLLVYVGCTEGSALIAMDRKVQTISGAVGDLVARSDGSISAATLLDYVKVASGIMTPYPTTDLVQRVTLVKVSTDGRTAAVEWSRKYARQAAVSSGNLTKGTAFTLPSSIRDVAKGQYVVVAETSNRYMPLFGLFFDQTIGLYRQNFYMPRFGGIINLS
jgi:Flp pilus assembly protein TadG